MPNYLLVTEQMNRLPFSSCINKLFTHTELSQPLNDSVKEKHIILSCRYIPPREKGTAQDLQVQESTVGGMTVSLVNNMLFSTSLYKSRNLELEGSENVSLHVQTADVKSTFPSSAKSSLPLHTSVCHQQQPSMD